MFRRGDRYSQNIYIEKEVKEMKSFVDRLTEAEEKKESILCVGLDPQARYMPRHILKQGHEEDEDTSGFEPMGRAIALFNEEIIKATAPFAAAFKPQMAFYEAYGYWGVWAFEKTVELCRKQKVLVIEDAKRCDGGDTSKIYAAGHLGRVNVWYPSATLDELPDLPSFDVDAMTVVPWIGTSCITPFREAVKNFNKGIFIVNKTSFKPNSEIEQIVTDDNLKVWEKTAEIIRQQWIDEGVIGSCGLSNIGVVVGATFPEEAARMRELLPDSPFLIPGYGAQKAGADKAVKGLRKGKIVAIIINSSRGIIFAYCRDQFPAPQEEFAQAAAKAAEFARDDLNEALKRAGNYPW